jgi:hypothetical protein
MIKFYKPSEIRNFHAPTKSDATKPPHLGVIEVAKTNMETAETQQNEVIELGYDVNEADVARPILQGGTYDFTSFIRPRM